MPLTDDEFAKKGKPKAYTSVIEELQEEQEKQKLNIEYDFELEEEDE